MIVPKTAMKNDLFGGEQRAKMADAHRHLLHKIDAIVNFGALTGVVEQIAPRSDHPKGGRLSCPTEVMVRVLAAKHMYGLSDEQNEFQLLDRRSFQRFCGLDHSADIPDRTTILKFENRIGVDGVHALFAELNRKIRTQGLEARAGQNVDAKLVHAHRQHLSKDYKVILEQDVFPADWRPAKRRQKDVDASWTMRHSKSYQGYKFTASVNRRHKLIRQWLADMAKVHDSQHLEAVLDYWNMIGKSMPIRDMSGTTANSVYGSKDTGPLFSAIASPVSRAVTPGRRAATAASQRSGCGWSISLLPSTSREVSAFGTSVGLGATSLWG